MQYTGKVREPLLPGETISIGDQEFIMPRCEYGDYLDVLEKYDRLPQPLSRAQTSRQLVESIVVSLRRNYPEFILDYFYKAEIGSFNLLELAETFARLNKTDRGEEQAPANGAMHSTEMTSTP